MKKALIIIGVLVAIVIIGIAASPSARHSFNKGLNGQSAGK